MQSPSASTTAWPSPPMTEEIPSDREQASALSRPPRLLVISHPAVLPVNQLVYAELMKLGWVVDVVVPSRWNHEYGALTPESLPALTERFHRFPVVLAGRPQRHAYLVRPTLALRRFHPDVVFLEQEAFSVSALQWSQAAWRMG